jgi:hypothetical protein
MERVRSRRAHRGGVPAAIENAGFGEDRVDGRVRAVAELTPVVVVTQLGGRDWLRGAQSPATAGEGRQNLICSYLAVAVLVGLLANTLLGIWWLDPVVAVGIAALARIDGRRAWRGESCGCATCATGTRG